MAGRVPAMTKPHAQNTAINTFVDALWFTVMFFRDLAVQHLSSSSLLQLQVQRQGATLVKPEGRAFRSDVGLHRWIVDRALVQRFRS